MTTLIDLVPFQHSNRTFGLEFPNVTQNLMIEQRKDEQGSFRNSELRCIFCVWASASDQFTTGNQ